MTRSRSMGIMTAAVVVLAACADAGAKGGAGETRRPAAVAGADVEERARLREVVVRTRDYAFEAPDTIESGRTRIRLFNEGPDFHHVWLVRLEAGGSIEALVDHLASEPGRLPSWAVSVGGPNTPGAPGDETSAVVDLEPGRYVMLCVIPSPDGTLHVMEGMIRPLAVVPGGPAAPWPSADVVMTMNDYGYELSAPIEAGRRTIRIENVADQPHEVVVVRLREGKVAEDFLRFLGTREGVPPGRMIGGVTWLDRGEVNQITLDFEPGPYALLCFVHDAGDGRPHFMHGMAQTIAVE